MLTLMVIKLIQRAMLPRVKAGMRNSAKSSKGAPARRSQWVKKNSSAPPASNQNITDGDSQPLFCAVARPKSISEMQHAKDNAPIRSKGSFFAVAGLKLSGGRRTRAAPKPQMARTAETKKFERQPKLCVSKPPITGPMV